MNSLVRQNTLLGQLPVVVNNLNIPKPPKGEPALLTLDFTTTLFHEFGHALHGLLSQVKYPRVSGTSVQRDFVEFPSQVNEMWILWPEVVKTMRAITKPANKCRKTGLIICKRLRPLTRVSQLQVI